MRTIEGREEVKGPGAAESSTAIRKVGAVKCPSIDITCVDDAVDCHLIPSIKDLWPRPANEGDDDLTEALRSDLRVAITEVLVGHKVRIVEP
jgi:hypothetical protein